jgi:hypothetical protein
MADTSSDQRSSALRSCVTLVVLLILYALSIGSVGSIVFAIDPSHEGLATTIFVVSYAPLQIIYEALWEPRWFNLYLDLWD